VLCFTFLYCDIFAVCTWPVAIVLLALEGLATLPQGNHQVSFNGQQQGWKSPSELEWASPWNVMRSSFSAVTLLVGRQEGHPACRRLGFGLFCYWWRFDWSFARLTAPVVTTSSVILSRRKSGMETFWYPYPGRPGTWPL